jgi:hypothetical protein
MASEIKDIFEYFATGKITLTKKDTTYWIRCYHKDNNVDWYYDNSLSYLDIPEFLNKFDFK